MRGSLFSFDKLNETVEKLETQKSKVSQLNGELDSLRQSVSSEKSQAKTLQARVDSLQRQEEIQLNLISSLKLRISELEAQQREHELIERPDLVGKLSETQLHGGCAPTSTSCS